MAWTRRRKKLKKRGDFLQSSTIYLFLALECQRFLISFRYATHWHWTWLVGTALWGMAVLFLCCIVKLYCQSNSWTLSVSSLSTYIYPKALFIGWIITPLGLTKWQHPFFFEVLKILGSQIIPHPFSNDTFFFWVWKILRPQPITIVFLHCED